MNPAIGYSTRLRWHGRGKAWFTLCDGTRQREIASVFTRNRGRLDGSLCSGGVHTPHSEPMRLCCATKTNDTSEMPAQIYLDYINSQHARAGALARTPIPRLGACVRCVALGAKTARMASETALCGESAVSREAGWGPTHDTRLSRLSRVANVATTRERYILWARIRTCVGDVCLIDEIYSKKTVPHFQIITQTYCALGCVICSKGHLMICADISLIWHAKYFVCITYTHSPDKRIIIVNYTPHVQEQITRTRT